MRIANPGFRISVPSWRLPKLPRFHVLRVRPVSEWALFVTIFFYVAVGVFVYFWLVEPWISGQIDVRIGADTDRLWDAATAIQGYGPLDGPIKPGSTLYVPAMLGKLLKSGFPVMCFNVFLFCAALKIAFSIKGINKSLFGFLMVLNAELFPSLTTLNKEIFTLLAAALTAKYFYSGRRSKLLLLAVCLFSLAARWEMLGMFVIFMLLHRWGRPKLAIAALIAAITVAYPFALNFVGTAVTSLVSEGENGNTITTLNHIQANYGFPVVVIPKIWMTLAGRVGAPWTYWNGTFLAVGAGDIQEQFFQPIGCIAYIIVFALAFARGKLNLGRPIAFLVAINLIWVAATPFVQPRYIYASYVLLCVELSLPGNKELNNNGRLERDARTVVHAAATGEAGSLLLP